MQASPMRVSSLLMMETGTYNPIYNRPYMSNMDGVTADSLVDRVVRADTNNITEEVFSGLGIAAISPNPIAGEAIDLPNGWGEKRIRFLLVVDSTTPTGSPVQYYLQGYTNHVGVSLNGSIDPNMILYVNSFAVIGSRMSAGANGMEMQYSVLESGQIINDALVYTERNHDLVLMRPHEIFTGIESSYMQNTVASIGGDASYMDTRLVLKGNTSNQRSNNIPNNYLTNVVKEYKTTVDLTAMGSSDIDIYNRCRNSTLEPSMTENALLRTMANLRGYGSGIEFTMSELELLDPSISNVTNYVGVGQTSQILHTVGQTEYWNGADYNTVAATILSNAVPALMMDLMLGSVHFRATNMDNGGATTVILIGVKGMTSAPLVSNIEVFKSRLVTEVLRDISYNNQEVFTIDLQSDIYGDTRMSISIGNNPMVDFVTPSFCDSILTPILSPDINTLNNLAGDFEQVINRTTDAMVSTGA